jgi:hypothetical protein
VLLVFNRFSSPGGARHPLACCRAEAGRHPGASPSRQVSPGHNAAAAPPELLYCASSHCMARPSSENVRSP